MGRGSLFVLVIGAALVAVTAALAGGPEQKKFNAGDQAAARAATLHRADLTPATGWIGGATAPNLSGPPDCPNYPVDLSKFVLTGAADTRWRRLTREVNTQAEVLQTAAMVRQEWRLQVTAPGALACLQSVLAKSFRAGGGTLVSFKRISVPKLAPYEAAFRLVAEAPLQTTKVRVVVEVVLLGKNRTEVEVTVSDLAAAQSADSAAALHYARILATRIKS
jgi:hypothetical protein